jgi:hypothetical protein
MENNMKFRAVSNLDADGCDPGANHYRRSLRSRPGQADVKHFGSLGEATAWLLKAGGGGLSYNTSDDSVAAVVQPGEREYRAITTDSREEFFASASAGREWLRRLNSSGWIEQYDAVIAKFTPLEKLEAA